MLPFSVDFSEFLFPLKLPTFWRVHVQCSELGTRQQHGSRYLIATPFPGQMPGSALMRLRTTATVQHFCRKRAPMSVILSHSCFTQKPSLILQRPRDGCGQRHRLQLFPVRVHLGPWTQHPSAVGEEEEGGRGRAGLVVMQEAGLLPNTLPSSKWLAE